MLIPLSLLRGGKRWGSGDSSLTPSHPISSLLLWAAPHGPEREHLPQWPEQLPVIRVKAMIHLRKQQWGLGTKLIS